MVKFTIQFEEHKGRNWPDYHFIGLSKILTNEQLSDNIRLVSHQVATESPLSFVYSKPADETIIQHGKIIKDQKLSIKTIHADDILLENNIINHHSYYVPNYNASFIDYCSKNNITVDLGPLHIFEFYHSGTWSLVFNQEFWSWYANKRKDYDAMFTSLNEKEMELYVGHTSDTHFALLNKLQMLVTND